MYTKFFGLNEKPFSITPDPRYLFMSGRHSEGLAHLVYGVKDSSGFIQLTGEVGTGKTTLVRTLLTRIPDGVDIALILNPQLSAVEFLSAICEELKIPLPADRSSTKALVDALNQHLLQSHADGKHTILLIDEAQNLATDVLEEVRLLTNLETAKQKLLQIILIAQPELREKLSQTNLRQLAQRVTGRYHLEPLSKEETALYIDHRLKVAGGLGDVFDDRAKREVYRRSGGVPRLINVICDRALLGAYSQEVRKVTATMVRKAASEVSGEESRSLGRRWLWPALGIVAITFAATFIWIANRSAPPEIVATVAVPLETQAEPVADIPEEISENDDAILDARLLGSAATTSTSSALNNLLSLWGVEFVAGNGAACAQARTQGLECLSQRGSWTILRQLNRPVVLTLNDSLGQTHDVVLVGVADRTASLQIGDESLAVSVEQLNSIWYGKYILLWKPPNGDTSVLRRGSEGSKVLWLRQSLAALDPDAKAVAVDSDIFDTELEMQLKGFQQRNRLATDGLAGHQTQIIMNSQLGLAGAPSLSVD